MKNVITNNNTMPDAQAKLLQNCMKLRY